MRPRPERSAALTAFDAELTLALGPLTAFARSLGSDPERAEELASATVAVALERRSSFDSTRALRPWLCGILVRLHGRGTRRHLPLAADMPAAEGFDPSLGLQREELARLLAEALPALTAADRAVLEPWLAGEERTQVLAQRLGLSPEAVRVRLHRARRRLRERLRGGLASLAALFGLGTQRAHAAATVTVLVVLGAVGLPVWLALRGMPGPPAAAAVAPRTEAVAPIARTESVAPAGWRSAPVADEATAAIDAVAPEPGPGEPFRLQHLRREVLPPGTVRLAGGATRIGTTKEEIQRLIEEFPDAAINLGALDGETPEQTLDVSPFFLGVTEVTNEQYAAFVRATGHRPPAEWGQAALDAAQRAFLMQRGQENQRLQEQGKPLLERTFDRARWWSENWTTIECSIPAGAELRPVTTVGYADVVAYCRWAGVRPMSELEFQHAVRGGGSRRFYPWGEEWEGVQCCAISEGGGPTQTWPVGSYEDGRSREGIYDLLGNVWEWTSSPYLPFPGFEPGRYEVTGRGESSRPDWDGGRKVVVGGSVQNARVAARATVRRPTERGMASDALGFRVAASPRPAADLASALAERWSRYELDPGATLGIDAWDSADGARGAPPNYAVITAYHHLAFVPVRAGAALGVLSTSEPLDEPRLEPGEYALHADGDALRLVDAQGMVAGRVEAALGPRSGRSPVQVWTAKFPGGVRREGVTLRHAPSAEQELRLDLTLREQTERDWRF